MNKLTKLQTEEHANLANALVLAKGALEDALATFQTECEQKWNDIVIVRQKKYNQALREADAFRDTVHAQLEDYAAGKSDKWREGDVGESFEEWRTAWDSSCDYEYETDLDMPDFEVSFDADVVDAFESLPMTLEDA